MSAPDRSWTIAPTLLWFCACLGIGLYALDGDVQALADRLTARRDPQAATAGPTFTARPLVVAEAPEDEKPARAIPDAGDRSRVGALEDVCRDGTPERCKRWGMDGFYRAVASSKRGKLGRAVRISWYGDSVIATDAIPSRLRARMQAELGDGGPGFVYIVPPHRFCHHERVRRSTIGDWEPHAISASPIADGMYGVGGATVQTYSGKATIKLVSGTATQVELSYLAQPKGGTATVRAGGTEIVRVETHAETKRAGHARGQVPAGAKRFEIDTKGKLRLFGIGLENTTGAIVDNFGIVSANARNFATRDVEHFTAELAHRDADLVMIMIGANEAHWLSTKARVLAGYRAAFERAITPLRKSRPTGSCLVISPLDQAEAKGGGYPSLPVMPKLVEAQRQAAHAVGCAFYSTYAWMGGKGSAARWYRRRLVGHDFLHLVRKGANKMADGVFDALITGYQRYARP